MSPESIPFILINRPPPRLPEIFSWNYEISPNIDGPFVDFQNYGRHDQKFYEEVD